MPWQEIENKECSIFFSNNQCGKKQCNVSMRFEGEKNRKGKKRGKRWVAHVANIDEDQ